MARLARLARHLRHVASTVTSATSPQQPADEPDLGGEWFVSGLFVGTVRDATTRRVRHGDAWHGTTWAAERAPVLHSHLPSTVTVRGAPVGARLRTVSAWRRAGTVAPVP